MLDGEMVKLDIPDFVYNWIVSFLNGHSHQTVFAGEPCDFADISASIIQGSRFLRSIDVAASDLHPITP